MIFCASFLNFCNDPPYGCLRNIKSQLRSALTSAAPASRVDHIIFVIPLLKMLLLFSSACQSYLSLVLLEQVQLSMRKITTKTAIHKEVMYKHFRKKKKPKAKWPLILFDSIPSKLPPLTSSEIAYLLNRRDEGACFCCFLEKNSCMKKHSHIVTLFKNILFRPTVKKFQRA